jgi:hypothetical protein
MIQSQKKDSLNLEVRKYKPGQALMAKEYHEKLF